jgi:hypothetical protein
VNFARSFALNAVDLPLHPLRLRLLIAAELLDGHAGPVVGPGFAALLTAQRETDAEQPIGTDFEHVFDDLDEPFCGDLLDCFFSRFI